MHDVMLLCILLIIKWLFALFWNSKMNIYWAWTNSLKSQNVPLSQKTGSDPCWGELTGLNHRAEFHESWWRGGAQAQAFKTVKYWVGFWLKIYCPVMDWTSLWLNLTHSCQKRWTSSLHITTKACLLRNLCRYSCPAALQHWWVWVSLPFAF